MKIKTVGWLAGAAMMLTSLTVWSVTPAGGFSDRISEAATATDLSLDPLAKLQSWQFTNGSTLMVEGRLGHSTLVSDRDNETFLYVDVKAPVDAVQSVAAPVNLAIVIDRSGSMSGKKMENAIQAARGMVQRLRDGDVVSLITYDTDVQTLASNVTVDSTSRQTVLERLSGITPGGDTCISCGLDAAMSTLSFRDGMVKRILLLSDGEATAGVRDVEGFRRIASRARDMGCSISSVGVDVEYNERIMTAVAVESNGRHYFVENPSGLAAVFDQELQSLVKTVATNAELRVQLAPGVELVQVFDRAFRREGNALIVPMGSFTAADDKTMLVKVRVPRGAEGLRDVASVSLAFQDLVKGGAGSCQGDLITRLSSDPSQASALDPIVAGRVGRAETAATLQEANRLFARGDFTGARARLTNKRKELEEKLDTFAKAAPSPRRAEVDADFDRQLDALADASDGFARPPAGAASSSANAGPPNQSRGGKVQVRENASQAAEMGF